MLADALAELDALASRCADVPTWSLSDDVLVDSWDTIQRIAAVTTAIQLHLVREIDGRGLPVAQHASSTAVWLRERSRFGIYHAKRFVDLARAIDGRPALDAALVDGRVNVEQAAVVAAAIQDLPGDLGPELVDKAEAVLIDQAGRYEPAIYVRRGSGFWPTSLPR